MDCAQLSCHVQCLWSRKIFVHADVRPEKKMESKKNDDDRGKLEHGVALSFSTANAAACIFQHDKASTGSIG